ncbi:uncharacterized protein B0I36DRAFT_389387, partial [Microdochium trichocladiopsis]
MSVSKPSCPRCGKHFTRVSSRNRHSARCLQGWTAPARRKACLTCATSKLRCGLERPGCARCRSRN